MTTNTTTKKRTTSRSKKPTSTSPQNKKLPPNPFMNEILDLVHEQETEEDKVKILQQYANDALKTLLIWNFDESIISVLPPGEVPYNGLNEQNAFSGTLTDKIDDAVSKMAEIGTNSLGSQDQGRSSIRKEYSKFYNFVKGGNDGLSSLRRETMFINILQGLHPLEAEILCLCKDKKLQTKYKLTQEVVAEAYPDIKWGNRS